MTEIKATEAFDLRDRVAIVTGASSGLGERFARVLADAGATLVLTARRQDRLESLAADLPDATVVATDITVPEAAESIIGAALDAHGQVDILVNNAGIAQSATALEMDTDDFRREIEIDLIAPYSLARGVGAHIIDRNGTGAIVNIGSVLGLVAGGRNRVTAYAAAKAGLHNLTRELASQWARKGVRVNAIAPGWFETEMNSHVWEDDAFRAYVESAPMGRGGEAHELDGALLFLCSDASSFVTGHVLVVDGGWSII